MGPLAVIDSGVWATVRSPPAHTPLYITPQGMTLDSLEVDLANCFDAGQAYVALSRATSMLSTRILSFNPHRVRAHPKVARFYLSLEAQRDREEAAAAASAAAAPSTGLLGGPGPGAAAGGGALRSGAASGGAVVAGATAGGAGAGGAAACSVAGGGGGGMSAEQLARMEANKAAALARRRAAQG